MSSEVNSVRLAGFWVVADGSSICAMRPPARPRLNVPAGGLRNPSAFPVGDIVQANAQTSRLMAKRPTDCPEPRLWFLFMCLLIGLLFCFYTTHASNSYTPTRMACGLLFCNHDYGRGFNLVLAKAMPRG